MFNLLYPGTLAATSQALRMSVKRLSWTAWQITLFRIWHKIILEMAHKICESIGFGQASTIQLDKNQQPSQAVRTTNGQLIPVDSISIYSSYRLN